MKLIVKSDFVEVEVDIDLSRLLPSPSVISLRVIQAIQETRRQELLIANMTPEEIMQSSG